MGGILKTAMNLVTFPVKQMASQGFQTALVHNGFDYVVTGTSGDQPAAQPEPATEP